VVTYPLSGFDIRVQMMLTGDELILTAPVVAGVALSFELASMNASSSFRPFCVGIGKRSS
jgi:hypothetical protein